MEHLHIFISMKTECSKCNQPLDSTRVGKQRYCKACHAEHMRATRPKHSQLDELQKKKANARSYLNTYLKRGKVHKTNCQSCGWPDVEAHHPDYDKPLEVIWYCRKCHLDHHN